MFGRALEFDWVLVGGGLANGLIASALLHRHPDLRLALVERDSVVGGNHTWCFHERDLPFECESFVRPLVAHRWDRYEVRFPDRSRVVESSYAAVTSRSLAAHLDALFNDRPRAALLTGTPVVDVKAHTVRLADGRTLVGRAVVDARGPDTRRGSAEAYQKFLGLELELSEPHGMTAPRLMDAEVPQIDGFRFVYTLPLDERRVLVEDTYYSTSPELQIAELRVRVRAYAEALGSPIQAVVREELGVLPLPLRGLPEFGPEDPFRAGYAGGWLHPTTGYSFPVATRVAAFVAQKEPNELCGAELGALRREHERQARFCMMLNRLLFGAFDPRHRFHVLERFYGLPVDTIARFYALQSTRADRARILCGRPPRGFSLSRLLSGGPGP